MNDKGCIYYTDFNAEELIRNVCVEQLKKSFNGDIVSVSLNKPLDLGRNYIIEGERSNTMYNRQILKALTENKAKYVFFTEHDVMYDSSHFEFTPPRDDTFYYDLAIWRWDYPKDRIINYDQLTSLSMMCCNRDLALSYYTKKLDRIIKSGWDKQDGIGNMQPHWMRALGYEPGTKRRRIGGFSDDISVKWKSERPCVDIRHNQTLSNPKTKLSQFKHLPTGWREESLSYITNFDLTKLFNLNFYSGK